MDEHAKIAEIVRMKDATTPLIVDPHQTALLVVDVQRCFARPDHAFGQVLETLMPGVTAGYFDRIRETVLPNIGRLQERCRAQGVPVVYNEVCTRAGDGSDLPGWMRDFDRLGLALHGTPVWPAPTDPSRRTDDTIAPLPGEVVLDKPSSGPLASTRLDQMLRNMGVSTIVVAGLTTDICVTQAGRELADRGFQTIIAADACTAVSERMHDDALLAFGLAFGRVRRTDDVLALLASVAEPALA